MSQDNCNFVVESATTFKPKAIKKADFSKLSKEGECQLAFYPDYVEVRKIKKKKKGKDYVKRSFFLTDVTEVSTDDKQQDKLRVFVQNKNKKDKIECHQFVISNSAEFQNVKNYFEKNTQAAATDGKASPAEAFQSERQPPASVRPGSRRPPPSSKRAAGRYFSEFDTMNDIEEVVEEDPTPIAGGFATGTYNQHYSVGPRSGYRPYGRMSGVNAPPSDLVESYIATTDRPRSSRPRYNGYQYEESQEGITEGNDFNSEYDPQTRYPRYKSSYVQAHPPQHASHASGARRHYSLGGASTAFREDDYRDYPRSHYDDENDDDADYYSEEQEDTYTVDYESQSNRTFERPNRPRSLPYYVPFLTVPHSRNPYW